MLLDLQTVHSGIRTEAKECGCEEELYEWKMNVIQYLNQMRDELINN